jgi:NAD-dependent deacetylase
VNASKEDARSWLRGAQSVAVLTGAGVSAESGIPTFRGAGGLWRNYRAEDLATPEAFAAKPDLVRQWYQWRRAAVRSAVPNPAHYALAKLERCKRDFLLITQNVDDLHERAGSANIAKLHGAIMIDRCVRCQREYEASDEDNCPCGGRLRPGVVWFGEALPEREFLRAAAAVEKCEVLLVVGTSAVVYPAAGLIPSARSHRAKVIEVNLEETPFSANVDCSLRGCAGEILPDLLTEILR